MDAVKTKKESAFITKLKAFTKKHSAVWQFIKFSLMSMIAAATEITSFMLLNSLILKSLNATPFDWWIFHYNDPPVTGGLGNMISFLVSTTIAQIVSFVTNRKKTFDANNNLAFSIIVYTVMMVTIICLQTYTGPLLLSFYDSGIHNYDFSSLLAKFTWMFLSFLIVFPMSKYVIMRKVAPKNTSGEGKSAE